MLCVRAYIMYVCMPWRVRAHACMCACVCAYMYVDSLYVCMYVCMYVCVRAYACMCNELGGNMARNTQFPIMITRSTIIYDIISPGAAGSSIYV